MCASHVLHICDLTTGPHAPCDRCTSVYGHQSHSLSVVTIGLEVSRLCLGCMSFGDPEWRNWVLREPEGLALVKHAWDAGINFFDTGDPTLRFVFLIVFAPSQCSLRKSHQWCRTTCGSVPLQTQSVARVTERQ